MVQKVLNENPVQILSDTFSISPSTTGYQLQVSANGKDYSTLFSVGPGVTRMCTGMANGSFYRLLGNVGEVSINWRTTCKGGGSGEGSTVTVNQILSAGTEIAQISVDGTATSIYAPEGGEGATAYYFNQMTQAELAALYTLLETEAGCPDTEGVLSASTINEKYAFFNDFTDPAVVPPYMEYIRLQFYGFYYGRAVFAQTFSKPDNSDGVNNYLIWLRSDGTFERRERAQRDFPTKGTQVVGYFDDGSNYIVFNKGNNTFTDKDGNALTNGGGFGGSVYWFIMHPIQGDWGNGIATVPFKVIDADSAETMHYYASVEMETLATPITIDGVEYTEKFAFKYPDFTFSGYVNSTPQYANLTYTEAAAGGGNVIGIDYSELASGATFPVNEIISAATDGDLVYMTYKPNGVRSIKYMYLNQIMGTSQKSFHFVGNGDDGYRYSATVLYDEGTGIVTLSEVTRTPITADALVHLETLSGVTGETNVMYECDGELFWWNPDSGYSAEWDGLPASGARMDADKAGFALNYAEIPDGTVLVEYAYLNNNNHSRVIKNGDKIEVRYESDNYETVQVSGVTGETISGRTSDASSHTSLLITFNQHSIIFRTIDNLSYFSSFWDGSVNTAHWEMATKPENQVFSGETTGIPIWDKSGKIIAQRYAVSQSNSYINTSGLTNAAAIFYSGNNHLPTHMFFPTSGGTEGQVLTSAGNAEPVWATMIKAVQITSADYEALATKDANTLYLIVDE